MKELERTFLAKFIPEGLDKCESKEIIDVFIPPTIEHPILRIRKFGDVFEMTKKEPVSQEDSSIQEEQTIKLTKEEFDILSGLDGKRVRKFRYYYNHDGRMAEIDVFQDGLNGLVFVDFEFNNEEEMKSFEPPEFCLVEITQETIFAGGMICGKSYEDIILELERFGYSKQNI